MTALDYELIDDASRLDAVLESVAGVERYAIDTEFHRERTYFPQLALIQIAWDGGLVLVDPLAVPVGPLAELFGMPDVVAVLHASMQDLEVLELATGTVPAQIFDTQIAAAFVGMRTPSLASLHDQFLSINLPKANRLTDWLSRPLEDAQCTYAASDVAHLLAVQDRLIDELEARDRREWAEAECELVRQKGTAARDPEAAWMRIKEARSLGARARAAAQQVAAWRERTAQERNVPVRHVLPDLAVVALAQRPPKSAADIGRARGLERRSINKRDAAELIQVLEASKDMPPPVLAPRRPTSAVDLRPAVTLIAAWMTQFADDLELDPAILGSRADIEDFVRGGESRLSEGWRHDLVGTALRDLLAGNAAVAFDGEGRVVVERRSFQPIGDAADG